MYAFNIHIHRRAVGVAPGRQVTILSRPVETLDVPAQQSSSLFVTFDKAVEILSTLPRMVIEPDGSFVWTGEHDGQRWQVDGVLVDQGATLACVEMAGRCPPDEFDQFLAPLGWPALPLMFQWTPSGVYLPEEEFRRIARQ